jgi:hypothetical protein
MKKKFSNIPRLTIAWDLKNINSDMNISSEAFPSKKGLNFGVSGNLKKPTILNFKKKSIAIFGFIIHKEKIDNLNIAKEIIRKKNIEQKKFISSLNGQFLIFLVNKSEKSVCLINDRFNGIPIYWAIHNNIFYASYLYFDLFKKIRHLNNVKINSHAMLEYLWLNRLLMNKTYDSISKFLMPASILKVSKNYRSEKNYWKPSFKKLKKISTSQLKKKYVLLLKQSVRRLTSDIQNKKYGLFLSGGHDSRTLLPLFKKKSLLCLTVAFKNNFEVKCARLSAKVANAKHLFIKIPKDHLVKNLDYAITLCGGQYSFFDAFFLNLNSKNKKKNKTDVVFHGHGLDYMFQGMYLPTETIKLFGRPTFFKRLKKIKGDIVDYYLNNIAYRNKDINIESLLSKKYLKTTMKKLKNSVREIAFYGKNIISNKYDLWEFFTIHALGRHYSRPNIDSKLTYAEQRIVAFDNDLFNFYLSLPYKIRLHGDLMRYALNSMNFKLGMIPTGNFGIPAGAPPFIKTVWLILRKILRHFTQIKNLKAPSAKDRTWPDREEYVRKNPKLIKEIKSALYSNNLKENLKFFDWNFVRSFGEEWISGNNKGDPAFLLGLVTLNRFLKLTT